MGLKKGEPGQAEEGSGKVAERVRTDELQDSRPEPGLHGCEESLPFPAVLFKELLPTEEGSEGDIKDLTDLLHGTQPEGMLGQDAEDEEQAVPAVGDDGIREHSVCGRPLTLPADQAADTKADLHRPAINEFDQGTVIVAVDTHLPAAPAVRAGLGFRAKVVCTILKNGFSGSFFTKQLAIDQVLSYHNSAL